MEYNLNTKYNKSSKFADVVQRSAGNGAVALIDNRPQSAIQFKLMSGILALQPIQKKRNNTGLPDRLKSGVENLSGHSMDDVKVHYNSPKPAQLNAHAFAQGTDIHLASGQEKHLPHEAWHVVQQKQGRVKPTLQMKNRVDVNDDVSLEKEADIMGGKSMLTGTDIQSNIGIQLKKRTVETPVIQGSFLSTLGIIAGSVLTGGLGALAYGGYRYYRHRRRENTLNSIRAEQANQNVVVANLPADTPMNSPSLVSAAPPTAAMPPAARNYTIDLNPNNPLGLGRTNPDLMRVAEMHERTHISADLAYSANQYNSNLEVVHHDPTLPGGEAQAPHVGEQMMRIDARLQTLTGIVQNDSALTPLQRAEILQRVQYAGLPIEYDPVINELVAYTKAENIRANSRTVKALIELARENLNRRRPGGPHLQGNWPA